MFSHAPRARTLLVASLFAAAMASCGRQRTDDDADRSPAPATSARAGTAPTRAPAPLAAAGTEGWNAAEISRLAYDEALRRARDERKPVCLVFHAGWCQHCRNYSHVFEDPRVVLESKSFEMVKVDVDADPDLAARYARDGGYVPRTFFLAPDGTLEADVHTVRPRFQYFYDERDPAALLAGMETALHKQTL